LKVLPVGGFDGRLKVRKIKPKDSHDTHEAE
jgi:hypothetical protein